MTNRSKTMRRVVSFGYHIRFLAISTYFGSFSIRMKLRLRFLQATPVVPLPAKQSSTVSPSLLQESIWSLASDSGNGAGWSLFFCGLSLHILLRLPNGFRLIILFTPFPVVSKEELTFTIPLLILFSLSQIKFVVVGIHFENTNINSKFWL